MQAITYFYTILSKNDQYIYIQTHKNMEKQHYKNFLMLRQLANKDNLTLHA